ncbi:unnamed protein product [Symbiodinium sp. CCMP2592]|nr:unnamed protein product [Symbiodinium sp. CCMP2592]
MLETRRGRHGMSAKGHRPPRTSVTVPVMAPGSFKSASAVQSCLVKARHFMVSASPGSRRPGAGRDELEGQGCQEVTQTLRGHAAGRPSISKVIESGWSGPAAPEAAVRA